MIKIVVIQSVTETSSSFVRTAETPSVMLGALVQLVRMPACHAGGHEFESRTHRLNLGLYRGFFLYPLDS